jgi:type III pantothenate kinase
LHSLALNQKIKDLLRNIVIDIGNTRIKWGIFHDDQLIDKGIINHESEIPKLVSGYNKGIISSVKDFDASGIPSSFLQLSSETPLPIQLNYNTPTTLGLDRIAAAVGAATEFENQGSLIVDLGTCVTYDWVSELSVFKGGAIAPGLRMRLKAMHKMTGKLPDLELRIADDPVFPGLSTAESMKTGALWGIIHEINGYISLLKEEYDNLNVILTGGDASFFESRIKAPIFVRPEIILSGLNRIVLYNETNA